MKDFRSYIPGVSDPAEFGVFERSVHKTERENMYSRQGPARVTGSSLKGQRALRAKASPERTERNTSSRKTAMRTASS